MRHRVEEMCSTPESVINGRGRIWNPRSGFKSELITTWREVSTLERNILGNTATLIHLLLTLHPL